MATNWNAYQAARELYGNNVENIQDIGSRFPLFSRAVMQVNDNALLDILGAIPKVSARVMETGLKALADGDTVEDAAEDEPMNKPEEKEEKKSGGKNAGKKTKKVEPEPDDDDDEEDEYENMTTKALYKLCCDRGISSQCKKRDKASLIAVLKANEGGKAEPDDEDDWGDDEEEEKDPYAGKSAKELYKMCIERGIKTKMKLSVDAYVKLLKKADAEAAEPDEEDEDDEWEI